MGKRSALEHLKRKIRGTRFCSDRQLIRPTITCIDFLWGMGVFVTVLITRGGGVVQNNWARYPSAGLMPRRDEQSPFNSPPYKLGTLYAMRTRDPRDGLPANSPSNLRSRSGLRPVSTVPQFYDQRCPRAKESILDTRYPLVPHILTDAILHILRQDTRGTGDVKRRVFLRNAFWKNAEL